MPIFTEILFRVAENSDYENILNFVREHYYNEEPITLSHPEHGHTKDDEEFTMSHVNYGTVLLAIDSKNNEIVGALISGQIEVGDADKMLEDSKNSEKKWSDIQKLLAYIEKKADVLGKLNLPKALHCHALGVHSDYRGLRLGQRLFEKWFELAKELNFELLSVDCTSIYSIKISEKFGMECISTVTYDEYNKFLGQNLFQTKPPNSEVKTFIKLI